MAEASGHHQALSTRLPVDDYEALRSFAAVAGLSMNEVIVRAVRAYLLAAADDKGLEAIIRETHTRLSTTLEKLRNAEEADPTTRAGRRRRGSSA